MKNKTQSFLFGLIVGVILIGAFVLLTPYLQQGLLLRQTAPAIRQVSEVSIQTQDQPIQELEVLTLHYPVKGKLEVTIENHGTLLKRPVVKQIYRTQSGKRIERSTGVIITLDNPTYQQMRVKNLDLVYNRVFKLVIDPLNVIAETNEDNNITCHSIASSGIPEGSWLTVPCSNYDL